MIGGMQLVMVLTVLVAAAVPGALATAHLFCSCSVGHHRDWTFALHCSREQNGVPEPSCKNAEVPDIPRGYHYVSGYALIKLYRTYKTWQGAKKACEEEGARLAIPPDSHAYDGLKHVFTTVPGMWYAFIGITDQASEGIYVGVDGLPVPYVQWRPNEPNNGGGGEAENCLEILNDGRANDKNCNHPLPFFCERRLSVVVPDSYTWFEDAGRFYKVHKEGKTYAEAVRMCRSENATLAVPDTWRRGEIMLSLLEDIHRRIDPYLIGFTDSAVEGDFVTETGRHLRDMEFQVMADGEPNNDDGGKPANCLALMSRGYYNDVQCERAMSFICEIAP